jgi:tetratricopeptide (TPR) repeat protein
MVRSVGFVVAITYAAFIVWLYAAQPQTIAEVTGGLAAGVGAYRVDDQAMQDGLTFFRREAFAEARAAFDRADPAHRDPRIQFYVAYSYYREGWGRVYSDDALYAKGIEAVDRAIAAAPDHRVVIDDPTLGMHTADELKAELTRGVTREPSDFNPVKVFRRRR